MLKLLIKNFIDDSIISIVTCSVYFQNMEFIMDVQGFKGEHNQFIIKELAIISTDGQLYELQLFQPPCTFNELSEIVQQQVHYLEKHFHGLYWKSGFQPYSELHQTLKNLNLSGVVYVKGSEKKIFVTQLLSNYAVNVVNIEELGCPSLSVLKKHLQPISVKPCVFNHKTENCAYLNVNAVLQWFKLEQFTKDRIEMVNLAMRECKKRGYRDLQFELVRFLPKEFILSHHEDVELIFEKLPKQLQTDFEIMHNLRCNEHYRSESGKNRDDWEGFNPKRKDCQYCITKKQCE